MMLLFPTVIHQIKVDNFKSIKNDLIKFVYWEREEDPHGVNFSNVGGWQSKGTYHQFDNIYHYNQVYIHHQLDNLYYHIYT